MYFFSLYPRLKSRRCLDGRRRKRLETVSNLNVVEVDVFDLRGRRQESIAGPQLAQSLACVWLKVYVRVRTHPGPTDDLHVSQIQVRQTRIQESGSHTADQDREIWITYGRP